jgi:two-component system cell cycle sensor histidine kinase/response regulator CckA
MAKSSASARARPGSDFPAPLAAGPLLRLLAYQLPAVIWTTDRQLRFTSSFGRGLADLGLRPGQLVGWSLFDYFQTDDPDFPPIAAHRRALRGEALTEEFRWSNRLYQAHLEPLPERQGVLGLAVDVTERDRAERARLAGEQRYRQLFEDAPDVIFTLDLEGNFTSLNKAAQRISGYQRSELLGANIARLLEPEPTRFVFECIRRALGGETSAEFELPILTKDGRRIYLEVSARLQFVNGRPTGIQGIARDVTERKRLEEQLRQSQKLEAIGELAGGVAHDFNNLLSAILGYADLLLGRPEPDGLVREAAQVIQKAAERAQQLAARLLGFARRGKLQDIPVDLHALLDELLGLLERTLPRSITIVKRFQAEPAFSRGDPGQLYQVFLNLALNARDAMPEGGVLTFQTELAELGAESLRAIGAPAPGAYVKVSVADTGAGIAEEHLPRLFEPFFTTKQAGGGSGMGLAMVYGIVKNHAGAIQVSSRPGCGSTFTVYLPLERSAEVREAAAPAQAPARAQAAILVIDDEPMVGQTAVRLLESLGYRATSISDPSEALEAFRTADPGFDLVLLDMLMPGFSGEQCLRALKAARPEIPVIVTSGYCPEEVARGLREAGAACFLPKPYQMSQLAEAVRGLLGA